MDKKFIKIWLTVLLCFLTFFFVYLFNLESPFIVSLRISGLNIHFPIPVLFFFLTSVFVLIYAKLTKISFKKSFFLILPLGIFWKLSFFLIGLIGIDPWLGHKSVFTFYSNFYLNTVISLCLFLAYKLKTALSSPEKNPLVAIPSVVFVFCLLVKIFQAHAFIYFLFIPLIFLIYFFVWQKRKRFISLFKRDIVFVILVFILGFSIRVFWGARVISLTGTNFYAASDDGITYGPNSEKWAKGTGGPSAFGTFGGFVYTIFLGIIYKFMGNPNYAAAVFFQSILGALVPVFIYYIGKDITNSAIAKLASLAVCLSMNNIFTSIVIGMEALFIPAIFLSLFLLLKYIGNKKIVFFWRSFLIGIIFGFANIVRSEILLFPVAIMLCFFIFGRGIFNFRRMLKIGLAFISGFLLVLALYCLRNYAREGKFAFATDSASISFGLVENGITESKKLNDMGFNPFLDLRRSIKTASEYPIRVTALFSKSVAKKGFNYLFCANFGEMDLLTLLNNSGISNFVYRFPVYCQFYFYLLVIAGFFILLSNKTHLLEKSIICAYVFYTILFYAVIYSRNARYRAVLDPLFIILFFTAAYSLVARFKKEAVQ